MMQSFFRKSCLLCGASNGCGGDLCAPCRSSLPHPPPDTCPVCALPTTAGQVCGACLAEPPAFGYTVAALSYAFPADALIHSLKYQKNLAMATILADLLMTRIDSMTAFPGGEPANFYSSKQLGRERESEDSHAEDSAFECGEAGLTKLTKLPAQLQTGIALPDFIVPMPLHPARLRDRGFNQALEIARRVSKKSGIALLPDACQRIKDTPPQTGLPWKEREKNIRGAFACEMDLTGKHVAVLDDVMTTGTTLNELAKVLRKRGATEVSAWVVARTLRENS